MQWKKRISATTIITYALLAAIAALAIALPPSVVISSVPAANSPDTITLHGVLRDFRASHPDFDVADSVVRGHHVGLVVSRLNSAGRPVFVGDGTAAAEDDFSDPVEVPYGFETPFGTAIACSAAQKSVATQVQITANGTLKSISAYIKYSDDNDDVRFAIYADALGEPGALIAESDRRSSSETWHWRTIEMPEVELTAGTYWLAIGFDDSEDEFDTTALGGQTRYLNHDSEKYGFPANWGVSDSSTTARVAIHATLLSSGNDFGFTLGGEGGGAIVVTETVNGDGDPIAPLLIDRNRCGVEEIDFDIDNQGVTPTEDFAVKVTLLGAAIQNGSTGYHLPVTAELTIGAGGLEPFGAFLDPINGNVNDIQDVTGNANGTNPRSWTSAGTYAAGTTIWAKGRSWSMDEAAVGGLVLSNWHVNRTADTLSNGVQIKVLRDGDPVPAVRGLYEQSSVEDYVGDYIDTNAGVMRLGANEIIYLFELGTTGTSSSADFQDLVLLVELADTPSTFAIGSSADVAGETGMEGTAGITSADTFDQWYRDVLGANLSMRYDITLTRNAVGVYEFHSSAFHPVDGRLLGNEAGAHNSDFTYMVEAKFRYDECTGQFISFEGDDDAWIFITGWLAMDLGGVVPGTSQLLELDRLNLTDGETYTLRFFHARRQQTESLFHLQTNIDLYQNNPVELSAGFD